MSWRLLSRPMLTVSSELWLNIWVARSSPAIPTFTVSRTSFRSSGSLARGLISANARGAMPTKKSA